MLTLFLLFFMPTIIAVVRGASPLGVFLVNFFLGWTIIGWWVALIWSLAASPRVVYVPVYR
jgi:T4 superinfection immunity protein